MGVFLKTKKLISQNDTYNFSLLSGKVLFVSAKLFPDSNQSKTRRQNRRVLLYNSVNYDTHSGV